jgi:hypothetical protein
LIFPDKAELFIACIEDADYKDEKIECMFRDAARPPFLILTLLDWNNVYGFDFSCIQAMAYREPLVDSVNADSVVTTASKILVCLYFYFVLHFSYFLIIQSFDDDKMKMRSCSRYSEFTVEIDV